MGGAIIHRCTPRLAKQTICQPRSCCTLIKRLPVKGGKKIKRQRKGGGGKAGLGVWSRGPAGGERCTRAAGPYLGRGRLCSRCAAPAPGARPPRSPAAPARTARRSAARGPRRSLRLTQRVPLTLPSPPQLSAGTRRRPNPAPPSAARPPPTWPQAEEKAKRA